MSEMKALSTEIREKLPKLVLDFVAIVITLFVAYLVLPIVGVVGYTVPVAGLSGSLAVALIFAVVLAVLAVRTVRDAATLAHVSANGLASVVPGLQEHQQGLVEKVAHDFLYVLVILILFYLLAPFVAMIPGVGPSLAAVVPIALLATVVIFLYDAGRLIYDEVQKGVHEVTEKIASAVEEAEKRKK